MSKMKPVEREEIIGRKELAEFYHARWTIDTAGAKKAVAEIFIWPSFNAIKYYD